MFSYKPELDGLRAIAVLSVILYHAGFSFLPGGFVGVDIFFVLSGFLITSILIAELDKGKFSFSAFYERRIRRLLPPLIPVLLATWLFAFNLFEQSHFFDTIKSLLATLAISANWYFFSSVGYFDGPGETTPLLHMWSLGIEEQFYLIFPLLLLLCFKAKRNPLHLSICLLAASFAYSTYLILNDKIDLAFYGSFGRFWELLVGSALACARLPKPIRTINADILEISGITLIITAVLLYSPGITFPGPSALVPTLGTALLIAGCGEGRIISPILKSKPLVWIGLISYGLYLWHWPIIVFFRAINPIASAYAMLAAISTTFLVAAISYYWLEQPIRKKQFFHTKESIYKFGLTSLIGIALFSATPYSSFVNELQKTVSSNIRTLIYDDTKSRILDQIESEKVRYMSNLNLNFHGGLSEFARASHAGYTCSHDENNTHERILSCLQQQAQANNILVIGDSIGRDTTHALRRSFPSVNFIMLHNSGCPPVEMIHKSKKTTCFPKLEETLSDISKKIQIDGIILNFSYRQADWPLIEKSIPQMLRITNNIVMLGVTPALGKNIDKYIKSIPADSSIPLRIMRSDKSMLPINYIELTNKAQALAQRTGITFANVGPFFCNNESCRIWLNESYEKPLYWDNQHITDDAMTQYGIFLSGLPEIRNVVRQAEI